MMLAPCTPIFRSRRSMKNFQQNCSMKWGSKIAMRFKNFNWNEVQRFFHRAWKCVKILTPFGVKVLHYGRLFLFWNSNKIMWFTCLKNFTLNGGIKNFFWVVHSRQFYFLRWHDFYSIGPIRIKLYSHIAPTSLHLHTKFCDLKLQI
jgi:hypothetical protein